MTIPQATNINELIVPFALVGVGIGMVESSMMPHLGYIVDLRHTSTYGNVYALGDLSYSLAFVLGPLISGPLVNSG